MSFEDGCPIAANLLSFDRVWMARRLAVRLVPAPKMTKQ